MGTLDNIGVHITYDTQVSSGPASGWSDAQIGPNADLVESKSTQRGSKKRILSLNQGGTQVATKEESGARPTLSIEDILSYPYLGLNFDHLPEEERPTVVIPKPGSRFDLGPGIDSSLIQPEHIIKIAEVCYEAMLSEEFDAIWLVCGSDTAAEVAAYLQIFIKNPTIPIVIQGSLDTIDEYGASDAKRNPRIALRESVQILFQEYT